MTSGRAREVVARKPSRMALAVRSGAPIEVTQKLMGQASIPRKDIGPTPVCEDEPDDLGVPR